MTRSPDIPDDQIVRVLDNMDDVLSALEDIADGVAPYSASAVAFRCHFCANFSADEGDKEVITHDDDCATTKARRILDRQPYNQTTH